MATTTPRLGLPRPESTDNVTLANQQALIDAIDSAAETPAGAQAKADAAESAAKSHANTVAGTAETNAKSYTDAEIGALTKGDVGLGNVDDVQQATKAEFNAHVGAGGSAHAAATTTAAGFMSASDKAKLNGIEAGAEKNDVTSVNGKTGAVSLTAADVGAATSGHGHANATTSAAGFMSASDKSKLNGIQAGAQVNAVTSVNSKTGAVSLGASDVGAAPSNHNHDATYAKRANNLSDLSNAATARNNLGLKSGATTAIHKSTADPSGGADGDVWIKYA